MRSEYVIYFVIKIRFMLFSLMMWIFQSDFLGFFCYESD